MLGADLSLVATGLVVMEHSTLEVVEWELVRTAKSDDIHDLQMRCHAQWLRVRYWAKRVDRIALEALAFGAAHGDTRPVAVYEVIAYRLWRAGYMWATVPSTSVKKLATGKGRAKKPEMVQAAMEQGFSPDVPKSLANNLADAYFVARWYVDGMM